MHFYQTVLLFIQGAKHVQTPVLVFYVILGGGGDNSSWPPTGLCTTIESQDDSA